MKNNSLELFIKILKIQLSLVILNQLEKIFNLEIWVMLQFMELKLKLEKIFQNTLALMLMLQ